MNLDELNLREVVGGPDKVFVLELPLDMDPTAT